MHVRYPSEKSVLTFYLPGLSNYVSVRNVLESSCMPGNCMKSCAWWNKHGKVNVSQAVVLPFLHTGLLVFQLLPECCYHVFRQCI